MFQFFVQPIPVRTLHDQVVGLGTWLRIGNDRQVRAAYIARETEPDRFPVLVRFERHDGRSEKMSRIESLVGEIFANLHRSVQEYTLEQREDVLGIFGRVNRFDRLGGIGLPEHGFASPGTPV